MPRRRSLRSRPLDILLAVSLCAVAASVVQQSAVLMASDWLATSSRYEVARWAELGKEFDETRVPPMSVERFELPRLRAVHFLFCNLLDRGVTSTSSVDFLGKNWAEFLRSRHVDVPVRFLDRDKL